MILFALVTMYSECTLQKPQSADSPIQPPAVFQLLTISTELILSCRHFSRSAIRIKMDVLLAQRELLYGQGVDFIAYCHKTFPVIENLMLTVSKVGDPSQAFTIYFPLLLGLRWSAGIRFMGTVVVCEWLNQVLKWILHGDRPYWWVHQSSAYDSEFILKQTPLTCETGPGVPSGHSQMTAVVWFSIVDTIISFLGRRWAGPCWVIFWALQGLMFMSRTYIAAHFPHQCVLGLVTGLLVVRAVFRDASWVSYSRSMLCFVALAMFCSALLVYELLLLAGFNPNWSVDLALTWCEDTNWIHIDTTPFYAMMRYSGSALGLAVAVTSDLVTGVDKVPGGVARSGGVAQVPGDAARSGGVAQTVAGCGLGVAMGQVATVIHRSLPRTNIHVFYGAEVALNALYVYLVVVMVPRFTKHFNPTTKDEKKHVK